MPDVHSLPVRACGFAISGEDLGVLMPRNDCAFTYEHNRLAIVRWPTRVPSAGFPPSARPSRTQNAPARSPGCGQDSTSMRFVTLLQAYESASRVVSIRTAEIRREGVRRIRHARGERPSPDENHSEPDKPTPRLCFHTHNKSSFQTHS
jgi:hypothetical protein